MSQTPSTSTPSTSEVVTRFGRYTMIRKIAHGGMATLYLARLDGPVGFEKFFAIKKIHPHLAEEQEFVTMFLDEARFAAQIQHPNVVQIFELGEEEGDFFFAMEYLVGESLAEVMKEMALRPIRPPFPLLAHVFARTATGLHAAHELRGPDGAPLGLVHRDVSPHNVLITYDGEVKLLDFGIAKATGRLAQTATGELKGKYAYMSPEQLLGGREVDRRADVFSLGVTLYETTTLRRLFKADNELLTLDKISKCEIPPPRSFAPDYPPRLEAILLRALRREPAERYQTAAEMAADLDDYAAGQGTPPSTATLAAWMKSHLGDRAEEKRLLLEAARTLSPREPGDGSLSPVTARAPRAPWFVAGTVTLIFSFLATLALLFVTWEPPPAPVGTLRVQSSPTAGVVSLDDGPSLGRTPLELSGLDLGAHTVEVDAPGFESREATFTIAQPGQLVTVVVPLDRIPEPAAPAATSPPEASPPAPALPDAGTVEPPVGPTKIGHPEQPSIPRFGYLNLGTRPWAEVYLGGRRLGTTPLVKARLPAGRRRLKLLPEGTPPARYVVVNVKAGQTVRKTVSF